jgi:ribosomal protein S18 acetylase RimI-like enzyme
MNTAPLALVEVKPRRKRAYWYTFEPSEQFRKPWWGAESVVSESDRWLSIQRGGAEMARCKFVLDERPQSHPVLGEMPNGQLDILALEVAKSARRCGIGRETLRAIREMYPYVRLTALNDDAGSRGFWDSVGWVRHESPNPLLRSERVTYSES